MKCTSAIAVMMMYWVGRIFMGRSGSSYRILSLVYHGGWWVTFSRESLLFGHVVAIWVWGITDLRLISPYLYSKSARNVNQRLFVVNLGVYEWGCEIRNSRTLSLYAYWEAATRVI